MMTSEPPCPASLDEHRAHGMIDVILQGLAQMHECDFVHGDMKPKKRIADIQRYFQTFSCGTRAIINFKIKTAKANEEKLNASCPRFVSQDVLKLEA